MPWRARLLLHLHQVLSWAMMLACLLRVPLLERPVPKALGIDEFALRRGKRYATVLIDAEDGTRIDALPDRKMESVTAWLREHPGAEAVCRDGASDFAQDVTDADPAIALSHPAMRAMVLGALPPTALVALHRRVDLLLHRQVRPAAEAVQTAA